MEGIEQAIRVGADAIERVEGREAIRWSGHPLPVARLCDLLGLPQQQNSDPPHPPSPNLHPPSFGVVVQSGDERAGLLVDEILGEREVLVKEFGPPLVRVKNVAGTGLLGGGEVVLILRTADLLKSARRLYRAPAPPAEKGEQRGQAVILVVDDSITTRTMEKNLLEAAGYRVCTAVDGMEAWTLLKSEEVDLVVSDLDMPRLDGFELTARIRADRKLADLPVVLVTALESRQDKERGLKWAPTPTSSSRALTSRTSSRSLGD
ncbi:MAG: response regulator [Candidatus Methylomirabilis sp.]|nr:response regulator [Candidatus Methylomirabilis sp.]